MTSPLATWMTELERRWNAVTAPDDGSGLSYRLSDATGDADGQALHRTWSYLADRLPTQTFEHEKGNGTVLMLRYVVRPVLRLFRSGRSEAAWLAAIADESELLLRTWSSDASAWGSGIDEVLFAAGDWSRRGDLALVTFQFTVLVERGA